MTNGANGRELGREHPVTDGRREPALDPALRSALLRLHARAWGISLGLLAGGALFIATNVLVLKGGHTVGPHLALLSAYLPGYRVSVLGSVIGFIYLFVLGYAAGRAVGTIYNTLARGSN